MAATGFSLIIPYGTVITLQLLMPFVVASPEQHVNAVEGGSAFFSCLVPGSVETSTVEWYRDDKGEKKIVHLYKHKKDRPDDQDENFTGKTILDHEGLKSGNVTLELQSVHLSNNGRYVCYIPSKEYRCNFTLNIVSKGQNKMTKGDSPSTTGPGDEDNQGRVNRDFGRIIVLPIVFLSFGIVIVILIKLARCEAARKNKRKRTDQENPAAHAPEDHQGASLQSSSSTSESSIDQASAPCLVKHTDTHG